MKVGSSLTFDQVRDHLPTDMIVYQQLVQKLMYLACEIRLDIAFVVGKLTRHNSNHHMGHICIDKQTLQYLKGTRSMRIVWGRNPTNHRDDQIYNSLSLVSYANSSYAGDVDDRKSVNGYCFFFVIAITTWYSK